MISDEQEEAVKKERTIGLILVISIAIFTLIDIFEDLHEGSTFLHALSEVIVVGTCLSAGIYLWRRLVHAWQDSSHTLSEALSIAREDAIRWKESNASITRGLSHAIDSQFSDWGLSDAQKEISLLLIKGLSFKEIADIRQTSEHTVRQQAATIYRKSGLEGRAQLSAFFLEDLFVPLGDTKRPE